MGLYQHGQTIKKTLKFKKPRIFVYYQYYYLVKSNFESGKKRNNHRKESLKNLKWISARLGDQLKNNWLNTKYTFVKEYIEKKGVPDLAEIEYLISGERISVENLDNMPKFGIL
jgi:hypothetical protein